MEHGKVNADKLGELAFRKAQVIRDHCRREILTTLIQFFAQAYPIFAVVYLRLH